MFSRSVFAQLRCRRLDAARRLGVGHLQVLEVHLLQLGQHLIRIPTVPSRYFPSKVVELGVVLLLLLGAPLRAILQGLESPVAGEGVVEHVESVAGHVHLINLEEFLKISRRV